jgi:hypothetical protein
MSLPLSDPVDPVAAIGETSTSQHVDSYTQRQVGPPAEVLRVFRLFVFLLVGALTRLFAQVFLRVFIKHCLV